MGGVSIRIVGVEPHLDPYVSWLPPNRQPERRKDFLRVFREVVDFAVRERVDIFALPGDIFDVTRPKNSALIYFARELVKLKRAGIHVFAVTGHHDRPRTASIPSVLNVFHEAGLLTLFYKLDVISGKRVRINGHDVWMGGLSYNPFLEPNQDPLSGVEVEAPSSTDLSVLLTHNSISGLQPYSPEDPILDVGKLPGFVDLVVAGHLHAHIFKTIAGRKVCYVGTAERLSFNEENQRKGFTLIEVEGREVRAEQIPTDARPMRTVTVGIPERGDLTELIVGKLRELSTEISSDSLVRVKLRGAMTLDMHRTYRRREILSEGNSLFFGVKLDESEVQYVESFEAPHVELETPLKELERTYREMVEATEDEEERAVLREAYELASNTLTEVGGW